METLISNFVYTQVGFGGLLLLILVAAFWKIHTELTKLRVEMLHQLNRDLLGKRFAAYGDLWQSMRPAAIYSSAEFGPTDAKAFFERLSKWYFSADGGLFLTAPARDFYFSLQGLLRAVAAIPGWQCDDRPSDPETVFGDFLGDIANTDENIHAILPHLKRPGKIDSERWKEACNGIAKHLEALVRKDAAKTGPVVYASIQQVSSILRSRLTFEIRSRLDVDWPTV